MVMGEAWRKRLKRKARRQGRLDTQDESYEGSDTVNDIIGKSIVPSAGIIGDVYPLHSKLANAVVNVETEVVRPKDVPKVFPWVHIANAKKPVQRHVSWDKGEIPARIPE